MEKWKLYSFNRFADLIKERAGYVSQKSFTVVSFSFSKLKSRLPDNAIPEF